MYCEPDKHNKLSVGPKYKERFRMLDFNLSKPDRVVIHKRISSSSITPKELALMSSTDLANEETKQSIKYWRKNLWNIQSCKSQLFLVQRLLIRACRTLRM
ncbi:hypothetical protein EV424DRAFT_1062634 [Suillus variegatus]|nr:hypothetical protein EV424DRAFT_1062634 [Suillus variegatus]